MRNPMIFLFLFFYQLTFCQSSHLEYNEDKWPANQVFHYTKSNWDGSNEGFISIYFKGDGWMESIKWHEGSSQVSIIHAKFDPESFSIVHFKNISCRDGSCNQMGEMYKDSKTGNYLINFGPLRDTIENIPSYWHSYDFDWASLMTAFLFKDGTDDHHFQRCDFLMIDGKPGFGDLGGVDMIYQGIEEKEGVTCNVYKINGAGLNNEGGKIWFDKNNATMMGFKIQLPDEDSYENVDFKYLSKEKLSPEKWNEYKKSKWTQ